MAEMITRCPSCGTSFRITDAQLKTAKGAVRCGSCLQIFRALDHLAGGAKPAVAATAAKPAPKAAAKPDAAIAAELPKFEYKRPPAAATGTPSTAKPVSARPAAPAAGSSSSFADDEGQSNMLRFDQSAIDRDDTELHFDDSDDLLISDDLPLDDVEPKKAPASFGDDLSESFIDLDNWKPKEKSLFDREPKAPREDDDNKHAADESWALELLEESDDDEDSTPRFSRPAQAEPEAHDAFDEPLDDGEYTRSNTGSFPALDDSDFEDDDLAGLGESPRGKSRNHADPGEAAAFVFEDEAEDAIDDFHEPEELYADPEDRDELLSRIEPEPVEFGFYRHRFNWRGALLWGSLVSLGVLALILQVAWLQYETLSRQEPYRSWYAAVGWDVPAMSAPTSIRASNLVVRSHPEIEDALMVDTILLNTASFSQPFPDLVLSFTNLQGKVLAARRFNPSEYLSGELAGQRTMPSNQPVHLSLEIVDPGPDAVNYTAYIPQD